MLGGLGTRKVGWGEGLWEIKGKGPEAKVRPDQESGIRNRALVQWAIFSTGALTLNEVGSVDGF